MEKSEAVWKRAGPWSIRKNWKVPAFFPQKDRKEEGPYETDCSLTGSEKAMALAEGGMLVCAVSFLFYKSLIPGAAVLPIFLIFYFNRKKEKKRRKKEASLKEEFRELAQMMSSFLLAGYSVENAMDRSLRQLEENRKGKNDMTRFLRNMIQEIRMGEKPEAAWSHFGERVSVEEIRDFCQIFRLTAKSGASLPHVLQTVSGSLEQKMRTEAQIETMIAGKKAEQKIMNLMPMGILAYICMTSPEMMEIMYSTIVGRGIMTLCLGIYLAAFLWSEKITGV